MSFYDPSAHPVSETYDNDDLLSAAEGEDVFDEHIQQLASQSARRAPTSSTKVTKAIPVKEYYVDAGDGDVNNRSNSDIKQSAATAAFASFSIPRVNHTSSSSSSSSSSSLDISHYHPPRPSSLPSAIFSKLTATLSFKSPAQSPVSLSKFQTPNDSPSSSTVSSFSAQLSDGMEVIKLDRHSAFKKTKIYLCYNDNDELIVRWDSNRLAHQADKAYILVSEVRLECGTDAGAFQEIKQKERQQIRPENAFSLLTEKRSLDIICRSASAAAAWIAALSAHLPAMSQLPACYGNVLRMIGNRGVFNQPSAITINPITGECLISDASHRIFILDRLGKILRTYGIKGGGDDHEGVIAFNNITGLAANAEDGLLYITDTDHHRIIALDGQGKVKEDWTDTSDNPSSPVCICVNPLTSHLYIADATQHKIQVYTNDGTWLLSLGGHGKNPGDFLRFSGLAIYQGSLTEEPYLYISDSQQHRITCYNPKTAQYLFHFGHKGDQPGECYHPMGLAVDQLHQLLYVVDHDNHRLNIYTLKGEYVRCIGREGRERGEFIKPIGVAVCPLTGLVYVTDTGNHRIQVFY